MTTASPPSRFDDPAVAGPALEAAPCSFVCLTIGSAWTATPGVHEIRCVRGQVWITQPNDPRDHVLGAGDVFAVRNSGVVVQALRDATIRI